MSVLAYCKNSEICMTEYPNNGVVRRLKNRNSWDKIWSERMSGEIFQAVEIKNILEIPRELADISKTTKQKYKDYLISVGNGFKPF